MIGRHSLTYTCSCEGCRRFVTVTYLQAEFDAQDRATQRGWSFRFIGRDAHGRAQYSAHCPTHPFFRFWTYGDADRPQRRAA